ncbi:MAG: N-6 DNA methylase [Methanophagales archaeon]|nr:N-6 DNA methylase [Methanophagales archaeon]
MGLHKKCESAKYRGDTGQNIGALENEHPNQLKDVIPKIYTKINLDHYDLLAYLINLFSSIRFGLEHRGKDIFSRIYEYFLGKFTEAEGKKQKAKSKKGGEFYTLRFLSLPVS